jgi:bifunctional DNA-binding transcriptional regulator/antitoxin component of YhaV-PrlF toxin-antitoxin module
MNAKCYIFDAVIRKVSGMDGAYIVFPYDIRKEFGRGRIGVHAELDGEPYDGSIVNMGVKNEDGSVCYILGIRKDIRKKTGKQPGDMIHVTVRERI